MVLNFRIINVVLLYAYVVVSSPHICVMSYFNTSHLYIYIFYIYFLVYEKAVSEIPFREAMIIMRIYIYVLLLTALNILQSF